MSAALVAACSAGDTSVDPGDLELRDLLGISPEIASAWSAEQRASARRVLLAGLSADESPAIAAPAFDPALEPSALDLDDRVAALLAADDARREAAGEDPRGVVRIALGARDATLTVQAAPATIAALDGEPTITGPEPSSRPEPAAAVSSAAARVAERARRVREPVELWFAPQWDRARGWSHLAGRGIDLLLALAGDASHPGGPLVVVPRPRYAAIAAYIETGRGADSPRLAINPVLLAALEPSRDEHETGATLERSAPPDRSASDGAAPHALADPTIVSATGGNPYSFYGSVAECAFAQRTRCEACLPGGTCTAITDASDGNAECTALAASSGRGYFLECINLSLAISSVERCTRAAARSCALDRDAASSLDTLDHNADFLDDPTCAGALDACLARIYGAPDEPFPGVDDGDSQPPSPPRSTSVNCGDSCDSSNNNCTASPSCECSGPSCNNSLSCDSACSSSNDQGGCNGNCDACTSSGGGGGGCGSGSSSSSNGCGGSGDGGSCGSCNSDGGGGSCGSCNSDGGGSSGGDGCGGGCNNDSSCGGGSSCGSGGNKCSAAAIDPGPGAGAAMSLLWGLMPVPIAALTRRRARRRAARSIEGADLASPEAAP